MSQGVQVVSNLSGQKADHWLLGARLSWGLAWKRHKGTLEVMAVFCLNCGAGYKVHAFIKTHSLHLKGEHFTIDKVCLNRFDFLKYRYHHLPAVWLGKLLNWSQSHVPSVKVEILAVPTSNKIICTKSLPLYLSRVSTQRTLIQKNMCQTVFF